MSFGTCKQIARKERQLSITRQPSARLPAYKDLRARLIKRVTEDHTGDNRSRIIYRDDPRRSACT
jgi:hypothetical protein